MNRRRLAIVLALFSCVLTGLGVAPAARAACQLNSASGKIKHVIYIEFDNQHFTRDNPNVPSDLEQQPNLLNFIEQNGTLDAGDHTVLISHTANDILTTQIGLYSDNHGIFVANSFGVFGPAPAVSSVFFPSSFFYWTDLVSDITSGTKDNTFALTTPEGKNVPAPWVPFTRAGCDVGAFSTANIVLERFKDITKIFGKGSNQDKETSDQKNANLIGEAIHCAQESPLCAAANGGIVDMLPDEPSGYTNFNALFGAENIKNALGNFQDLDGKTLVNRDSGLVGFTGFDPTASQTLGAVASMLEKGIPIVFAYVADAHDNQEGTALSDEHTFGPGEAPYVKQLADYNRAWGQFFDRLEKDGIDKTNTLFVITPDEGDHFAGNSPSPANCDGVNVPCTYPTNGNPAGVGEFDYNLNKGVADAGNNTTFSIHFDDAPTVYIPGAPGPSDTTVRQLEKTMAGLSAIDPFTGQTESLLGTGLGPQLQGAIVDPITMKLLHMNTAADSAREPSFTFFGDPNFFFLSFGSDAATIEPNSFVDDSGFAWNHGDIQPEIGQTFIGIVGPGVRNKGVTQPGDFFTDHVDVRPTILSLVGLTDDYQHDGRVILEVLDPNILPSSLHAHSNTLRQLGQIYKQIDAPFGQLAQNALTVSTFAITSNSLNDQTYSQLENHIASWTTQRDSLAAQIKSMLEGAEFNGLSINEQQAKSIISQGQALLNTASACASDPAGC